MKAFAVFESDLEGLAYFNTLATTFFSCSSGFASLAIGIITNAAFVEQATAAGDLLVRVGTPILGALTLLFLGLGFWSQRRKASTLHKIKTESFPTMQPIPGIPNSLNRVT